MPIRYAGYTAWRGVSSVPVEAGRLTESWGVGERFGLVDIGRGRTYWFATKNTPEGEPDERGGRKAEIRRRFSGWHEPIAAVVEAADESAICGTTSTTWSHSPAGATAASSWSAMPHTRPHPASDRARRRRSRMPSSSPIGSQAAMTSARPSEAIRRPRAASV